MTIKKRYCHYCGTEINYKWFCKNCSSWCMPHSWILMVWFVLGFYIIAGAFLFVLEYGDEWVHFVDRGSIAAGASTTISQNEAPSQHSQISELVQSSSQAEESVTLPQEEAIEILAPELRSAIAVNPVRWHFEHDDKRLRILGVVESILGNTQEAKIRIYMGGGRFISCTFSKKEDVQKVSQLSSGSLVVVEGFCSSDANSYSDFRLNKAVVVELPPRPKTLPDLELTTRELTEEMADNPLKWMILNRGRRLIITGPLQEAVGSYIGYSQIVKVGEEDLACYAYGQDMAKDAQISSMPAGTVVKISGVCLYKDEDLKHLALSGWRIEKP